MSISLICACKNRYEALKVSLNSWLNYKEIGEIIIVDWSSDVPISNLTELDKRIKVVRVEGKQYFNQPQPLNLAAKIATGYYILKVDTDYVLNPYYSFIESYFPGTDSFTSGVHNYQSPEFYNEEIGEYMIDKHSMDHAQLQSYYESYSPFFKYLTGLLFISKENFNKVGGYNENLTKCYAYEDDEIFQRLRLLGLRENKLNFDYTLIHLPHPDKKRTENFKGYEGQNEYFETIKTGLMNMYQDENQATWNSEYSLALKHIEKNREMIGDINHYYTTPKTHWNITQMNEQNYIAEELPSGHGTKLEGFPTVYYLSLEGSSDRRKELERQFSNYNVIPRPLISKKFKDSNDNITGKYVFQLNDGTKGCCVSHLKAIEEWYRTTDEDYVFICEDDLSLETINHWNFTWEEFIESIPEDAECVQLFAIRDEYDTFELRERYWNDWGATAYILTRDYAKKIIDTYIQGDTYHLEIPNVDVMPLIENILFASVGKTYTIPLFVENTEFNSTFVDEDDDVNEGQKNNHRKAKDLVLNYWRGIHKDTTKTELEQLLHDYALDPDDAERNFQLALWYDKEGHSSPSASYYLRCAERAKDDDLAYEALIRCSYCYQREGDRDGTSRGMLFQAQAFRPDRPEAYFLLSRYAEKREWWQDCYLNAHLALLNCNFDVPPLRTDVGYPGKYGLLLEKSVSGWWWGKGLESRLLLQEIKNNHKVKDEHFNIIQNNLMNMATGYIPESELKYNKNSGQKLRFKFDGWEKVERNYSQSFQDLFVLAALNGKTNGTYLEIGAQEPFYQNNTALLETTFNWKGISIEIREDLCKMFAEQRKNEILCKDATKINYKELLDNFNQGEVIDYLQVDCEPSKTTYDILLKIPFDKYKFRVITYEHDYYVDLTNSYRDLSRKHLEENGYKLFVSNVSLNEWAIFEDWWYHPDLVDEEIVEKLKNISDVTDIREYMIEK